MKNILYILLVLPVFVFAQSPDQNWVKSKTYKTPTSTSIATPTSTEAVTQVNYFDGLGRPIQQVTHAQSNSGKDIVTHIEYDALGRQTKEFLPYANQSASLNYNSSANTEVLGYYYTAAYENTINPFSEKLFEASPLNRVQKQAAPGLPWGFPQSTGGSADRSIKLDYQTNTSTDAVKLFTVNSIWDITKGLYDIPTSLSASNYSDFQLYKTITKDENWTTGNLNTIEEFKNKEGKVVLKRTYNKINNVTVAHNTYYIYDQFGNLTFVIPPAVDATTSITGPILDNMCYQYKYDYSNRLVEKKLPGKQWEYIVYDKLDRVVATGPAYNPYGSSETNKGWLITKYDMYNRPVYTAWYVAPVSLTEDRKALQTSYDNAVALSETKTSANKTINDVEIRYSNTVFPAVFLFLTINYYDDYDYPNAPIVPTTLPDSTFPIATNVKGLPTGSWVRVLDVAGSTTNELSYTIYDNKYRPVRTYDTNYLGGYTQVDSKIDWAGKTEYTFTKHKRSTNDAEIIIKDSFEYSTQDRLVKHKHKINGLPEQLLSLNTYDELGQLTSKKVGGTDITGGNALQKVDYTYNIRGWLTGINDVTDLTPIGTENDLFAFKLNYNQLENGNTTNALYNGNIVETLWRTDSDNIKRKYLYKYDDLNRLLEANYSKPGSQTTPDNYLEKLEYDKNGNITKLERNGGMDYNAGVTVNPIDKLTYNYNLTKPNQLESVYDDSRNPQGFTDEPNVPTSATNDLSQDYYYDANGNMTIDNNKGIETIVYNHLNLPVKIIFATRGTIDYIYNALGQKVKKITAEMRVGTDVTDYLTGFQYKNNLLTLFPHAEGYVNVTVSSKGLKTYKYVFNYTDHLGNVRLSYSLDASTIKILEENHYYPFGLKHSNYNTQGLVYQDDGNDNVTLTPVTPVLGSNYKYKYNGQELQDELGLNMTAMDWRQYDSAIGRFVGMDVFSELYVGVSPYSFVLNMPTVFSDPSGMSPEGGDNDPPKKGATRVNSDNSVETFNGKEWTVADYQIETVVIKAVQEKSSVAENGNRSKEPESLLFGLIKNPNVNSQGQSPLEVYREKRGNPGYNPGEGKMDRIFRLIGNSHIEIMQDFGGGGYNMYGGYGRAGKAFNAAAYADDVLNLNKATEGGGVLLSSTPKAAVNSAMYYSSEAQQGASIFRSIISNHMFIDGNKRTAIEAFKLFAQQRGLNTVSNAQMQNVASKVATGQVTDIAEIAKLLIK